MDCLHSLSQRERVGVVERLQGKLKVTRRTIWAPLSLIDGLDSWVLLIEPRPLNICMLLWVMAVRVHLTCEIRDQLDSLILDCSDLSTCLEVLVCVEGSTKLSRGLDSGLSKELLISSIEV